MLNLLILFSFILTPSISTSGIIIGGETIYRVVKGDTLELIGAKLGIDWRNIVKENQIDIKNPLVIGQELRVNTRKIVPEIIDNGIIINIPDRLLYFFKEGKLEDAFPVGLGMPSWRGITRWRTPEGKFTVVRKRKNPTWYVPESMQWKMKTEGKPVRTIVLPGQDNPLGRYAVDLSIPRIVIHETIWPTTVYQFRSHGCIRVLPENIEFFFEKVEIGTSGEIIYMPVKIAVTEKGRIFLEVHKDIYGKVKDLNSEVIRVMDQAEVVNQVNRDRIEIIIKEKSGIAEDVTL